MRGITERIVKRMRRGQIPVDPEVMLWADQYAAAGNIIKKKEWPPEILYKKGYAICRSDIVKDCWHCRFFEEVFTVKDRNFRPRGMGNFLVWRAEDLRKTYG